MTPVTALTDGEIALELDGIAEDWAHFDPEVDSMADFLWMDDREDELRAELRRRRHAPRKHRSKQEQG